MVKKKVKVDVWINVGEAEVSILPARKRPIGTRIGDFTLANFKKLTYEEAERKVSKRGFCGMVSKEEFKVLKRAVNAVARGLKIRG